MKLKARIKGTIYVNDRQIELDANSGDEFLQQLVQQYYDQERRRCGASTDAADITGRDLGYGMRWVYQILRRGNKRNRKN